MLYKQKCFWVTSGGSVDSKIFGPRKYRPVHRWFPHLRLCWERERVFNRHGTRWGRYSNVIWLLVLLLNLLSFHWWWLFFVVARMIYDIYRRTFRSHCAEKPLPGKRSSRFEVHIALCIVTFALWLQHIILTSFHVSSYCNYT